MTTERFARAARLVVPLAGLALSGCAVGPNFRPPAPPAATSYTAKPVATTVSTPGIAAGTAQRFRRGEGVAAAWWGLFRSPALNQLVERALANNPDLAAAEAALAAAQEEAKAAGAGRYPALGASVGASRLHDPAAALAPVPANNAYRYALYTGQVGVSYVPDVFGGRRRARESAAAEAEAARFQAVATWNTLAANVVVAAIDGAALQAQIAATQKLLAADRQALGIVEYQLSKGYASGLDVAAAKTQLAGIEAALPALVLQQRVARNRLAALTGQFPDAAVLPALDLATLHLPATLPVSLPSALVAQRPDIRQAEANLHAASAAVGVAAASRLPEIQLTADVGSMALAAGKLFTTGTGLHSLVAALTAPIFQGGALAHGEKAAKAAYREAAAEYRSTVLKAFQDVANTLAALDQDAAGLNATHAAAEAAKQSLALSRLRFQQGYASELAVLNAEQAWQQAETAFISAEAARYSDTAALFEALGGGWWHHPVLTKVQDDKPIVE